MSGETPLHTLLNSNLPEKQIIKMTKVLLKYGADPYIKDKTGQNCIQLLTKYKTIHKLFEK